MPPGKRKYIFISGGVISGLGKGVTSSSITKILKSYGFRVTQIKCEMYVNIDAGTIRPTEHGEVFVCADGTETDQDLGTYERFSDLELGKENFITHGQIYLSVIQRERNLEYGGEDVEVVPHVPMEIISRIKKAGQKNKADIVIVELGGTVGEYQQILFLEAARMMKLELGSSILNIHMSYLPIPPSIGEMKSKPAQHAVRSLHSAGIVPDIFIGRASRYLDKPRINTLSRNTGIPKENIFSNPDVKSIYEIPLILNKQKIGEKILELLEYRKRAHPKLHDFEQLNKVIKRRKKSVKIGIVGKYFNTGNFALADSYVSVIESIKHAAWHHNREPEIQWINSKDYETNPRKVKELSDYDGVIIPGGFGKSGVEGKIKAVKYLRENKVPYLGLCLGLQMAVIEFARHVCNLRKAHTVEVAPRTPHPVIGILPEQAKKLAEKDYGATMRLGDQKAVLEKGTIVEKAYGKTKIIERHRHRWEVNPQYIKKLEKCGLIFSGKSPNRRLMEFIELPKSEHPFFVGTQAHPEFLSRPNKPHPLFREFINAAK
ncbi:CTP synthase [Patescibacteria group bacterium]